MRRVAGLYPLRWLGGIAVACTLGCGSDPQPTLKQSFSGPDLRPSSAGNAAPGKTGTPANTLRQRKDR